MIRVVGFVDTRRFTASFVVKYDKFLQDGLLKLRDIGETGEADDLPIVKDWLTAKALLGRIKTGAAALAGGKTATLGKAWIEQLPGGHGTPWTMDDDDYAQTHIRTRLCLIPTPDNYSFCGLERVSLGVGVLNVVEHRLLCSEVNFSQFPRVHLVVDVKRPADEPV